MKKVIVGIVLIGIVVVVAAPFANGLIMKKVVDNAFNDFNQIYTETGSDMALEIVDYDRGFSTTKITWKISLGNLKSLYGFEDIVVVDTAKHGYLGVESTSSLAENQWYQDLVNKYLDGKDPLHITTQYSLMGNIESTIGLDAFTITEDQQVLESGAGQVIINCGKGLKTFGSKGSYSGLTIQETFNIGEISFGSQLEKISTYIWEGDGSVTVANFKATAPADQVEANNLTFGYELDYQKKTNTLSMSAEYGVDHFAYEAYKIDNASVEIGVKGMDAQGYENLMMVYSKMMNSSMDNMAQAQKDPEKMQSLMQAQMITSGVQLVTAIEKILKDGLELKISDLKATLPDGKIKGDIALGLKKDMTMAQFIPIASQPSMALDIFSLHSDISLPASLIGEDPRFFVPLYPGMQTGLFQQDGDRAVHKAETKDGKLYLNGEEFVLN